MSLNRSPYCLIHFIKIGGLLMKSRYPAPHKMYILCLCIVISHQNPINVENMSQPIWEPIQRRFGLSCIHLVHFLCKYTHFHDMRIEFQIINTSHSFLTVLLISHKSPAITWSLAPQSLKNRSLIAPQSLPSLLKLCCKNSSWTHRLQTWTLHKR